MVSKDQGIGGAIFVVCVIVAIGFVVLVAVPMDGLSNCHNQVRCGSDSCFRSIHRHSSDRRMDRLYNGYDAASKTNRRNNHLNRYEKRRTKIIF